MRTLILALVFMFGSATTANAQEQTAYVSASTLNLRSGPGSEYPIVDRLTLGDTVRILDRQPEWSNIATDADIGWVATRYLSDDKPQQLQQPLLSDARIREILIRQSLSYYSGSCPCPYNTDRAGRSCGRRSAYSRPGGASPLCYPSDVSREEVEAYRQRGE